MCLNSVVYSLWTILMNVRYIYKDGFVVLISVKLWGVFMIRTSKPSLVNINVQ